ncbi:MAG: MauE/DoxX family redox-associated membrane protein [Steroidobacteraceae bacterium]
MMTTDPLLPLLARATLAALFALACWHKLRAPAAFAASLNGYHLLPQRLVPAATAAIIACEATATIGIAIGNTLAMGLALALLALYTLAIAVNLARGRRDIDCGCAGPAMRQTLSHWLLVRNALLIGFALLASQPSSGRALTWLDAVTLLVSCCTLLLLYASSNQLAANHSRLGGAQARG